MTTAMRYDHKVDLPVGEVDGACIERFEVTEHGSFLSSLNMAGRGVRPGLYTRLYVDGRMWMSDTHDEWRDHMSAVWRIRREGCRRVLINGLGIGMVLKAALACEHIEHVDVVEVDGRVVDLVGPHYDDPRVTIHTADAYTKDWPAGTRWDVVWHDIWLDLCTDNLSQMTRLHRKYGRRAEWQGSWGKGRLLRQRRVERRWGW